MPRVAAELVERLDLERGDRGRKILREGGCRLYSLARQSPQAHLRAGGAPGNLLALLAHMLNLMVRDFMTRLPHTVAYDQSLADAHNLMRTHDIRHLPVLKDGRLAGIVSLRDLYMIETLRDIDLTQVPVADAMTTDIYAVGPRTSVRKIAEEMATHKYGSAVVMDGDAVVGIFTTIDALAALSGVLDALRQLPESGAGKAKES